MILFIKHIDVEGPGTIETYFEKNGYTLKTIDLSRGGQFPDNTSDLEAVVVLGGPMNVYEEDKFPWLRDENKFIQKILREEIPLLGICLGAQLIAKASGAKVTLSPVKEVGWFKVRLEDTAKQDLFFAGLNGDIDVFQWHADTFDIPHGGALLAAGQGCRNQAYKVGKNAYGVQFHVEVTGAMISDWCKSYFNSEDKERQFKAKNMVGTYQEKKNAFLKQSDIIYRNFSKIILNRVAED